MTKYHFIILAVFCSLSIAQNSRISTDIRIIESDDRGMTIELLPEFRQDLTINSSDGSFALPQFKNSLSGFAGIQGSEDIRNRVISIAVPSYSGNSVSVIASDFQTITGFSLAPIPNEKIVDDLGTTTRTYKTNYLSRQNFYPQQIVQLSNVGMMKNWLTANLSIAPYQYNSSEKILRKYTRIVIRVDFGARTFKFDQSGNDEWAMASLANYSTAKRWTSSPSLKKSSAANSVLATGTWIKLEVVDDGMYKIDANYLKSVGIEPSTLSSITDVKMFGADGRNIPESVGSIRPADVPQLAVEYVDNNSNGKFDSDDYILFYGRGVNGWNYDAVNKTFTHYVNPYTFSNYYFLTVGTTAPIKKIPGVNISSLASAKVSQVGGKVFFDEEKYNFNQSGQLWFSPPMNANESRVISNKLPGWVSGSSILYRYKLFSRATADAEFILDESGQPFGSTIIRGMSDGDLNSVETTYANGGSEEQATIFPTLIDQRSNVKLKYQVNSSVASGFIDWIRIYYRQNLIALNDQIIFDAPDSNGVVEFSLSGFTSNDITIYEVSDVNNIKKISYRLDLTFGSMVFGDTLSSGSIKKYWAGTVTKFLTPKSAVKITNSNYHGYAGADFVIITHNDFISEALRLKAHKESLPGIKKLSTVVIDVDTLYNEFGIGMPDPTALRDFLRYAVNNWTVKPKYALFFGDASYDFRSIQKNDRSWVPTYQTSESNNKIYTYSNDDFFVCLDPNEPAKVSISAGRLTPRTSDQARLLVDRIIQYESKPTRGNWKNVITIVADDQWTPGDVTEYFHTTQAEDLVQNTPKDFDIKRIYAETYPALFTSAGRRKPDVRQAILDNVNQGTLLLNFTGHGNPKVWAHESILTLDDVRNQFVNNDKLTFIVAATCDWGRFEEAGEPSSAEEVMFNTKGGAIGVLSATRAVYSHLNAATNQAFYSKLFSIASSLRLGDAYSLAKNELGNDFDALINKQKYFLMGDPTLRLAVPESKFMVDSLVSEYSSHADTIHALDKITIKGTVRDSSNARDVNYNGTALINVHDADIAKSVPTIPWMPSYNENGGIIYKGEATIKDGIVNTTFIVPKDIAYQNKNGRIAVYFSNVQTDGRGYTKNFIVGGSNKNFLPDSAGPSIQIFFDNTNFRSGDVVNENPLLIVKLKDSSGINSSANSIGHRLEAWIDGSAKSIDLTESYKGDIDSYQQGSAEYQLSGLAQGSHSIEVRAWDAHNNSSSTELFFNVASSGGLSILDLYNFPNPVSTVTAFTFHHNQLSPIDVTIHIFTVTGRRVHTIERFGVSDRFVKIDWNRRDSDGDELGNGIYFYKVIAKTIDGQFTSEAIGKMAVVR